MTKIIFVEKEVFDTDKLKVGQKILYTHRSSYSDIDDWDNLGCAEDSGEGEITYINEDTIEIKYNGYYQRVYVTLTVDDLKNGFNKFELI